MSGHSKWSTIKHKKALTDAKRGKVFSKLANLIALAAKKGSDPEMNPTLRLALEKAKQSGMPKENIERAVKKGSGDLGGINLEEIIYESYGPGGVGIIIEAITDNKNRTISEIRAVLNKLGGKMATTGSVSFMFEKKGLIQVDLGNNSSEELSLLAIDAGAEDIVDENNLLTIITDLNNFEKIKKLLAEKGFSVKSSEISIEPKQTINVEQDRQKVINLLETLDDLDDVVNISTNAEL